MFKITIRQNIATTSFFQNYASEPVWIIELGK